MTTTDVRRAGLLLLVLLLTAETGGDAQRPLRARLDCGKCDGDLGPRRSPMVLVNAGGKCLDAHEPEMRTNGGRLQVWDCKDTAGEYWSWRGNALVNGGGKCLQAAPQTMNQDGGVVRLRECSSEAPNQQWRFENGAIISHASGLCLDVHRPEMDQNGGRVQLWTCVTGQPPQTWHFESFQTAP